MIHSRKYRGVYFAPRKPVGQRWAARVRGRDFYPRRKDGWRHLGYHATAERAAFAIDCYHYGRGNWSHKPLITWRNS